MADAWTDREGKRYYPSLLQEERRVKAILRRDFAASLLSNTRWRELLGPLEAWRVPYTIKFIDVAAPMAGRLSHRTDRFYDSEWGPLPILSVEWIELPDPPPEVSALIERLNLPCELKGDAVRVVAHLRAGQPMPSSGPFEPATGPGAA